MDVRTKMLLKIQSENLLPKGSGGDKPSLDHKVFHHFFLTRELANVPKYIFKHLIKSLEDSQTIKKNFVPYGRLLSEIFHQIGVLDALKNVNCFTDAQLGTVTGRIINGATMVTMKLIKKEDHQELSTDLKESSVISNLMDDFPPICKQDPLEVRVMFIKEYYELTGQVIKISDIPDEMYGGALPISRNRKSLKRKLTEAEYLDATPEFAAKVAKTSAPESHPPASDMIIPKQEALEADDSEHEDPENIVEISFGNSSSHISSDSSDLFEGTLNFIRQIDEKLQTATQSVPNKTDSVNQQTPQTSLEETPSPNYFIPLQMILPEPVVETVVTESVQVTESESPVTVTVSEPNQQQTHQTNTKQTSTSTLTPTQTQTQNSPQKAIPEPVVETVVPESVQVTESEQTVAITVSEQIQTPSQPQSIAITNDQPSSSSTIQTQQQTTPNLLKSEFLEAEMLAINNELQRLVQLRRSPTLKIAYQE